MSKNKSRSTKILYKALHKVHLWVGLTLSIPLVLLGLTGSILVFEPEITNILNRTQAPTDGKPASIEDIIRIAVKEAPADTTLSMIRMPDKENKQVLITFNQKTAGSGGPRRFSLSVDPVSLEIMPVSESPLNGLFRFALDLHANLLVKDYGGRSITGWLGIVMLILSISGVYLWWPKKGKWTKAFKVKKGAKAVRLYRDLHKTTGIWGLLIILTVSFSGVYLAFPQQTGTVIRTIFPGKDLQRQMREARATPVEGMQQADILTIVALAENTVPDGILSMVRLPRTPENPYHVSFIAPGYKAGEPMITVQIDPWKNKVINVFDPREYTTGEVISMWQRTIHGGHGLNLFWKVVFFFSGFLPLFFALTGTCIWLKKRAAAVH